MGGWPGLGTGQGWPDGLEDQGVTFLKESGLRGPERSRPRAAHVWNVRNAGRAGKEPLEAGEMEVGTARGRPPSPGQQRRLLPWEEKELGRRPRRPKATGLWRSSECSGTKSARWRRDAPTVTDWTYQTMQQRDAAAVKVLDLDPCERSVTQGAMPPKGRKGRRPGRKERWESPEAQRFGGIADGGKQGT